MYDEDTGEELSCPYCDEEQQPCEHFVACMDYESGCCGGYSYRHKGEVEDLILEAFRPWVEGKEPDRIRWVDGELDELWGNMLVDLHIDAETGEMYLSLPQASLTRLMWTAFMEGGGDLLDGISSEGSGDWPGYRVYAREPAVVMENTLAWLRNILTGESAYTVLKGKR
jgi:hypothetical protein